MPGGGGAGFEATCAAAAALSFAGRGGADGLVVSGFGIEHPNTAKLSKYRNGKMWN